MNKKLVTLVFSILVIYLAFYKNNAEESPKQFFNRYIQLMNESDSSVVDLYSDNAIIRIYKEYPNGKKRVIKMTGKQWKETIVLAIQLMRDQDSKAEFSDVTISKYGKGYKIKANGYSSKKCYTDTDYYMVIESIEGGWHIIEERVETISLSNC